MSILYTLYTLVLNLVADGGHDTARAALHSIYVSTKPVHKRCNSAVYKRLKLPFCRRPPMM